MQRVKNDMASDSETAKSALIYVTDKFNLHIPSHDYLLYAGTKRKLWATNFFTNVFFYILIQSAHSCAKLGGGIEIKGFLRRLILHGIETGVQVLLVIMGFPLSQSCQAHEWLRGSLEWVVLSHAKCVQVADAFFVALKRFDTLSPRVSDGATFLDALLKTSICMVAMSTWAPDLIPGHLQLTVVIMDHIFGKRNWENAFGNEHPAPRGVGKDIYDDNLSVRPLEKELVRESELGWISFQRAFSCLASLM